MKCPICNEDTIRSITFSYNTHQYGDEDCKFIGICTTCGTKMELTGCNQWIMGVVYDCIIKTKERLI